MALRLSVVVALLPGTTAFRYMQSGMQTGNLSTLDPNRILCPVLAALHNNGALVVDEFGDAERAQIKSALKDGTWCSEDLAEFQSAGIAGYAWDHKLDQQSRDRCLPGLTLSGTHCWNRWLIGSTARDVKRYLNIFEMNGLETVEHGMSTGVRGGNCNSPIENDLCNGQYPCEALFQKFYVAHADRRGRLYQQQILEILCHASAEGDRSGEFAYQDGDVGVAGLDAARLPARQWQMRAAMLGWLSAFGRADGNGDLYFTIADARAMLMDGRTPDGWERRRWGCITHLGGCPTMPDGNKDLTLLEQIHLELPCNQYDAWWQGTAATTTGQSCTSDRSCDDSHALCLSHRCTCGKGRNGLQMLFQHGRCTEQSNARQYMGETCRYVRADHPESPNVWD